MFNPPAQDSFAEHTLVNGENANSNPEEIVIGQNDDAQANDNEVPEPQMNVEDEVLGDNDIGAPDVPEVSHISHIL